MARHGEVRWRVLRCLQVTDVQLGLLVLYTRKGYDDEGNPLCHEVLSSRPCRPARLSPSVPCRERPCGRLNATSTIINY